MKCDDVIRFKGVVQALVHLGLGALVVTGLLLMSLSAGLASEEDSDYRGYKACSHTSKAAFAAKLHEVKDDYWIAVGNCNNISASGERRECLAEAREGKQEGYGEAKEQLAARLEVCDDLGEAPYDPAVADLEFVDPLEIGTIVAANPYLPLIPGTVWVYEGGGETITVTVTDRVKEILGVPCIVVRDVVEEDGEFVEDTDDWFAQDTAGNVWYFGEISRNFEDGELVDLEGSWEAGRDSAKAGYVMKLDPVPGEVYRQEFFLGDAEDMAKVVSIEGSANVPAAACSGNCLITEEYTPLSPGVYENKYYAPGVGMILEVDLETGDRVELVKFETP